MDYLPDEIVYRCISEACADLKEPDRLNTDFLIFSFMMFAFSQIARFDCFYG